MGRFGSWSIRLARVDAQRRLYRVRAEPLRQLDDWLAPYRAMWASHLDALESHLAEMDQNPPQERA